MLKQLNDLTEFAWIQDNLDEILSQDSENWKGNFVSHCLPKTFDGYCKIFHPIFVDLDYVHNPSITWDDVQNDEQTEKLTEAALVDGDIDSPNFHLERLRWESLTKQYGLKFHSEISNYSFSRAFDHNWPRYLVGPSEGKLDRKTCNDLVSLLEPFTGSQLCFFEYFVMATKTSKNELLYSGNLNDIEDTFLLKSVRGSPTYWWPEDHSWCLCTDWDLCFTILGGTKEIIENVLMHEDLEALKVAPYTRIDWYGDQINFPE